MNRLYYGDCLTIMQEMSLASVDLIYLDPPFKSNRDYNAIYKDETGRPLPDQIEAFCDMWTLDEERERCIRQMPVLIREAGIDDETAEFWRLWMNALRTTQPSLLAYLSYMVERLVWMKGLLRPTGSIYLHCDPTASHYIKIMMDSIFGHNNFRNEIIWKCTNAHPLSVRKFESITQTILYYVKGSDFTFKNITTAMSQEQIDALYTFGDEKGLFTTTDLSGGKRGSEDAYKAFNSVLPPAGRAWAPPAQSKLPEWAVKELGSEYNGLTQLEKCQALDKIGLIYWTRNGKPRLKRYLEGNPQQTVPNLWLDIAPAKKKMGYDTEKPVPLLERIIKASTSKGDVVFDPFCGCATTLEAAHRLERKWIGVDIAIHAIKRVAKARLEDRLRLAEGTDFIIEGVPRNLEGAQDLWKRDKYHFQKWAVEEVDGFVTTKRTADGGIDGRIYFPVHKEPDLQSMVLEVKGGKNVTIADLRALHSVLEREEALMAGLIVMEPLGKQKLRNFAKLMAEAGDLNVMGRHYSKMQILTVPEILEGKRFDTPGAVGRGDPQKTLGLPEE